MRYSKALVPVFAGLVVVAAIALAVAPQRAPAPVTRTYYVAAEEITWDYLPGGGNRITGEPFDEVASMFVTRGPDRVGGTYLKSLYREYTDQSFTTLKPRPPEWEHLGFLGPLIRASVGDTIRVVFKNNTRYPASVHPHGVFYLKGSEGAPSLDGTSGADRTDDAVQPGQSFTYVWPVPERAGPAAGDPSSILWMYHSHVNEDRDVNSGLMGPMIVTRRGSAKADATPNDVDRELVVAFFEVDENLSWHLLDNLRTYTRLRAVPPPEQLVFFHPFGLANFKESMNGFLFGHLPGLTMRVGERVRWYLMAGTDFEIHAPHWHGNTVTTNHMRTDVTSLMTMGMQVADMVPDNPGTWLFHCHVRDHLNAGMQAQYAVLPAQGQVASSR